MDATNHATGRRLGIDICPLRGRGRLTKRTIKHAKAGICQVEPQEVALAPVKQSKIGPNLTRFG